jgi:hypothetical protein
MVIELNETPQVALQELHRQDEMLFAWVQICKVTDPASKRNAENMLSSARYSYKRADQKRRELLKPIEEAVDGINNLFRPYLERLKGAIDVMSSSLTDYQKDCIELAREEQQKLLIQQAEAIAQARTTGEVVQLPTNSEVVASPPKTSHADMCTVTYRKQLVVKIVNPDLVPRDLCEPSISKINARAKSGVVDIPGCLITEDLIPVTRRLT